MVYATETELLAKRPYNRKWVNLNQSEQACASAMGYDAQNWWTNTPEVTLLRRGRGGGKGGNRRWLVQ